MRVAIRRGLGLALPALLAAACSARHQAPPPTAGASGVGPGQNVAYTSGRAEVRVGGRGLQLGLQPSRLYPSPPAVLVLAFGDPDSGAGLAIQAPPTVGVSATSERAILSLALPSAAGLVSLTSMDGECSITLGRAGVSGVRGSFRCAGLRPETRTGPPVSASGTFSAAVGTGRATPAPAAPNPTPSPTPTEGPSLPAGGDPARVARVRLGRSPRGRLQLELRRPAIFVPRGGMQLFYGDGRGTLLGIGGAAFTGSRETSTSLTVALSLRDGASLASSAGECTVSIRRVDRQAIRGRFSCPRVPTRTGTVRLWGSFRAAGLRGPG